MGKPRIALITTWFPPQNGVAVNRMEAFARYLADAYSLEIFTLGTEDKTEIQDFGNVHYFSGNKLLDRIKHKSSDGKIVHHVKTGMNLLVTKIGATAYRSWKKKVAKRLTSVHREQKFDAVISSFSPVAAHEVALQFKKQYPDTPWIADMRDEMSTNPFLSDSVSRKLRKKEREFAPFIDAITTVSGPLVLDFKKQFPEVNRIEEIRNGYDHDLTPSSNFNMQFTLVYAGTFYGMIKPDYFFKALTLLQSQGRFTEDFKIRFVGTNKNFSIPHNFVSNCEFVPRQAQLDAVRIMMEADCNLLVLPKSSRKGVYSGKLFDYLSTEKPILALVDLEDVAAELILDLGAGVVVDFNDVEGIALALQHLFENWKNRKSLEVNKEQVQLLHRKHQVTKLKHVIESIRTR